MLYLFLKQASPENFIEYMCPLDGIAANSFLLYHGSRLEQSERNFTQGRGAAMDCRVIEQKAEQRCL